MTRRLRDLTSRDVDEMRRCSDARAIDAFTDRPDPAETRGPQAWDCDEPSYCTCGRGVGRCERMSEAA